MIECKIASVKASAVKQLLTDIKVTHSDLYTDLEIDKLKNSISNIYYNKPLKCSYQTLYTTVENMCTLGFLEDLYKDLTAMVSEFLELQVLDLVCYESIGFLRKLKDLWLLFRHKTRQMKNIYAYLEMYSMRKHKQKINVEQMCLETFHNIILSNKTIQNKFTHVYDLIESERNGKNIDGKLINGIVSMLQYLHLYGEYFEKPFLDKTRNYYKNKCDILLTGDIVEYFYYVQLKITDEENRVINYLLIQTESKVLSILYHVFIEEQLTLVVTKLEQANIFDKDNMDVLVTVYELLVILTKASEDLCHIFANYITKKGTEMVFEMNSEGNLIANLLEFKDKIDEIVVVCFRNNSMYVETVRSCFKKFINERKYKPAQLLAKFIDSRMRDKQIPEDFLDKIMVLFRYIQGKDVFEAYYKRHLSKRLLLGKSSSQDAEKYMISKLKIECGDGFTAKLEGMFKDIDLSDGFNTSFRQRHASSGLVIDFTAHVLTSSFWPTFPKNTVTLPDNMLHYQNIFHEFYKLKYSGRSLQWIPNLGSCLLKANFKNGKKELHMSLYQTLVMLLFNECDKVSYKSMLIYTGLDQLELLRTALSLTSKKTRLLIKDPPGSTVNDEDIFELNQDFSNRLFRIKINELQYKETEEEQKMTESEVMHDRHLQVDAALVRLMKQSQKLRHSDLIAKMFEVIKFPVNPSEIKKRIEILIERDFLARNPEDSNSYYYVA